MMSFDEISKDYHASFIMQESILMEAKDSFSAALGKFILTMTFTICQLNL